MGGTGGVDEDCPQILLYVEALSLFGVCLYGNYLYWQRECDPLSISVQ
jgi:hypothetical protein